MGVSGAGRTRRVPGRDLLARPLGTRGGLGCIRGSSQRGCRRDTHRTRRAPGCGLRVRHSGSGGVLGDIWRKSPGGSTRGQVSRSEASGLSITRCAFGVFRWHVSHSQASGVVSLAGLHGAPGSFREGCGALGDTCRAPKVGPKGVSGWHVPKEAFGLAFGTSVILRRFPKGCFDGASKGSSGRVSGRFFRGGRL